MMDDPMSELVCHWCRKPTDELTEGLCRACYLLALRLGLKREG